MPHESGPPRIAEHRKAKGWSQAELGRRVGMTQGDISNWETGEHSPSGLGRALAIAKALGVSVEALWAGRSPQRPPRHRLPEGAGRGRNAPEGGTPNPRKR